MALELRILELLAEFTKPRFLKNFCAVAQVISYKLQDKQFLILNYSR